MNDIQDLDKWSTGWEQWVEAYNFDDGTIIDPDTETEYIGLWKLTISD